MDVSDVYDKSLGNYIFIKGKLEVLYGSNSVSSSGIKNEPRKHITWENSSTTWLSKEMIVSLKESIRKGCPLEIEVNIILNKVFS